MNKKADPKQELMLILEKDGYACIKSTGKFEIFDLIAFRDTHVLLIHLEATEMAKDSDFNNIVTKTSQFDNHPSNCHKILAVRTNTKCWNFWEVTDDVLEGVKIYNAIWLTDSIFLQERQGLKNV